MKKIKRNNILTVEMNFEQLNELIYWIVMKFKKDSYHNQFISNKNDDLGCFFDRWIGRFPEYTIINCLLKNKNYSVVKDNFLYGKNTQKNSPDVIGLEDEENIYPLSLFNDGKWEMIDKAPKVEIKTFKEHQNLITIPESQFEEDKYYVIVISNLKDDYLLNLFDEKFFSNENFNKMNINKTFIKSDSENMILNPVKLIKPNEIGFFELFGIYKGENIEKISILTKNNPRFLKSIVEKEVGLEKLFEIENGLYYHLKEEEENIPIYIEKEDNSRIYVNKIGKTFIDIIIEGKAIIDNYELENNGYRLNYNIFKRGSNKKEMIFSKNTISQALKSEHEELIKAFDNFIKNV